jgi:3-methylfumaryl-CoA hydratase
MITSRTGTVCIEEEQTIVYRGAGARAPPVVVIPRAALKADEVSQGWTPPTVELFRYSSATFNSHRIHYDRPYAMEEEGYPGLVVHGSLTATRLYDFAEKIAGRNVARFTYRGDAPAFADQVRLVGRINGAECSLRAERAVGVVAMSAAAVYS